MMAVVMVLCGTADGTATAWDGQFLQSFDFEAHDGQGEITMTPDPALAKRFADHGELHRYYTRSPVCRPTRGDGRPNRPLTATTWELRTVPDEPAGNSAGQKGD